jgi:hypothetical protein
MSVSSELQPHRRLEEKHKTGASEKRAAGPTAGGRWSHREWWLTLGSKTGKLL